MRPEPLALLLTPVEAAKLLAERVRSLRLRRNWTRETLSQRAGVSAASLKRFENTGKASLDLLLRAAHALDRIHEFSVLLQAPEFESIKELERRLTVKTRKRGRL